MKIYLIFTVAVILLYNYLSIDLCGGFLLKLNQDKAVLSYTTHIDGVNGYSLEVVTKYLNDSLYLNEKWLFDENDVVIEQFLVFKYNDSVIKQQIFNVKKRVERKSTGKVSLLDNVIRGVSLIKGEKGYLYKVVGGGGCNACSEYDSFYSLNGNILWYTYSSQMDKFSFEKGNYNGVLEEYGIIDTLKISPLIDAVRIFPPQYSGNIYKIRLR